MAKKNKNSAAQYAFIGLILAALGCVSSGLLGVTKGLVALQVLLVMCVKLLLGAAATEAGPVVVLQHLEAFLLPLRVAQLLGVVQDAAFRLPYSATAAAFTRKRSSSSSMPRRKASRRCLGAGESARVSH